MKLLNSGDKVGIVACSNGLDEKNRSKILDLENVLGTFGLNLVYSERIYKSYSVFNGNGRERAEAVMKFFLDKEIKAIFDVSGGDVANEVLEYLDFEVIKKNPKPFFGYSDLSVVINALYSKTNMKTYLYQIRNLVESNDERQIEEFKSTFMGKGNELLKFKYEWIQGRSMEGTVVGGNIRCLLKLSGTEYMPDFKDKIILFEGLGGDVPKMVTYLTQYKQLGVFKKVKGIILGSFTEMEKEKYSPNIVELLKEKINDTNIPIVKTSEIGHGKESRCIIIGEKVKLFCGN